MIKNGKLEAGKTPSEKSGRRSERIVSDQPLSSGENPDGETDFSKAAAAVKSLEE